MLTGYPATESQDLSAGQPDMLVGKITKTQLYETYPDWKMVQETYKADTAVIREIRQIADSVNIVTFLGTWCFDSEMNVPPFFAILEAVAPDFRYSLTLWAVDRKKKLDNNLPERYNLQRVPTFIVERQGKELGRIVESPETTLEKDLLRILRTGTSK
jgi:hypothetical protein